MGFAIFTLCATNRDRVDHCSAYMFRISGILALIPLNFGTIIRDSMIACLLNSYNVYDILPGGISNISSIKENDTMKKYEY